MYDVFDVGGFVVFSGCCCCCCCCFKSLIFLLFFGFVSNVLRIGGVSLRDRVNRRLLWLSELLVVELLLLSSGDRGPFDNDDVSDDDSNDCVLLSFRLVSVVLIMNEISLLAGDDDEDEELASYLGRFDLNRLAIEEDDEEAVVTLASSSSSSSSSTSPLSLLLVVAVVAVVLERFELLVYEYDDEAEADG